MSKISNERASWLGLNVLPHEPLLRAWLSRKNLAGLEVDDVIQDTYAALITLESVAHIQNVKAYVFQISNSVIGQHLRRAKIIPITSISELDFKDFGSDEPSPENITIDRDELNRLAKAIGTLPEKVRQVFTLRRVHGLSQREVSLQMGIAESTVEKHMRKGFELLSHFISYGGNLSLEASKSRDTSPEIGTSESNAKKNGR